MLESEVDSLHEGVGGQHSGAAGLVPRGRIVPDGHSKAEAAFLPCVHRVSAQFLGEKLDKVELADVFDQHAPDYTRRYYADSILRPPRETRPSG